MGVLEQLSWSAFQILCRCSMVFLVKSKTGKDLLMMNGYTYYQHKQLKDGHRWSCTQMGSRSCRAYLHVTPEKLVIRAHTEHTHPPSTYFLEKIKRKYEAYANDSRSSLEDDDPPPFAMRIGSIKGRVGF